MFLLHAPPCTAAWVEHPGAIQAIYQDGVPHTDRQGAPLDHFDPEHSFLPIGLYHAVNGDLHGRTYRFQDFADAGFNTLHLWEGQHLKDVADAAKAANLQLIIHRPTDAEITGFRDHPAVLGWYLDEEPTGSYWGNANKPMAEFFADFVHRRDAIRQLDPRHPVFAIDLPLVVPPMFEWWKKWNTAGDVSAHDNYPIGPRRQTLSFELGIPQSVSMAVKLNEQRKPVWVVVQAFEIHHNLYPFNMPTARQLRAMTYAAFIYGATGVIDFALDSWVTRDGNVVGMAADPQASYGSALVATQDQLRGSRDLWNGAVALNKELHQLIPVLLSRTSKVEYHVELDGDWPPITKEPICTLLKEDPSGGLVLLVANVDDAAQHVRIRLPGRVVHPQPLFDADDAAGLKSSDDHFELIVGPFAAFAFHL